MTSMKTFVTASAALLVMAVALPASAQTKPATKPAAKPATTAAAPAAAQQPPLQFGPAVSGVCLFSQERAVATSNAGQAANQRMQQLRAQVQAELGPERTSIEADAKTFEGERASLTPDQLQQKGGALQKRANDYEQKAQLRERELQVTGQKALQRIGVELEPIVRNVFQQRGCSLLLNADNAVFAANPTMDITSSVSQALNAKLPTISFDREHLDVGGAAK